VNRIFLTALIVTSIAFSSKAQYAYEQQGEFGVTIGAAHYFGDLNTRAGLNRPKPAFGAFFRKQFGNYVAMRVSAHFLQLGYSDKYSKNEYQKVRNLSFNTSCFELALRGDFNFFKYVPGDPFHSFTPYITLGVGIFTYDPYAYLYGEKIFLRPLGTEGQTSGYQGRSEYSTMAVCIPFGVGIKYSLSEKVNLTVEIAQRFTTTDYLDDVSSTYAGPNNFPDGPNGHSVAYLLQDRSYETRPDDQIGKEGAQRGWSKQKDQFVVAEIGLSFNFGTYKCPSVKQ
jgi:hypothetical protein